MRKNKLAIEYLIYENNMKKKVRIYLNYFCGIIEILEFINRCQVLYSKINYNIIG